MKTGNVLLGVLAGAATGALLGVLFAPEKGSVTRKKIATKGGDYADELRTKFETFLDSITNKYETVKNEAEDMVNMGKEKYDGVKTF